MSRQVRPTRAPGFNFTIPSLPKAQYEFLQRVRAQYGVDQRQVVIVALDALMEMAQRDRAWVERALEQVL